MPLMTGASGKTTGITTLRLFSIPFVQGEISFATNLPTLCPYLLARVCVLWLVLLTLALCSPALAIGCVALETRTDDPWLLPQL
ncbi:hypothetical protein DL96DRAFT_1592498 [Flagelloscypha sp. PMI_526]|nr:hypothetical protein DL96DRAFT_1592498 [Flagelloscypha sp. PMI_526]